MRDSRNLHDLLKKMIKFELQRFFVLFCCFFFFLKFYSDGYTVKTDLSAGNRFEPPLISPTFANDSSFFLLL